MKAELAVLCQALERIEMELQPLDRIRMALHQARVCVAEILAESVTSASIPQLAPDPIPAMTHVLQPRLARHVLHAPGELENRVLAMLADRSLWKFGIIVQTLQAARPGTRMDSVTSTLRRLVEDGRITRVSHGVYQIADQPSRLSLVVEQTG